MGLQLYTDLTSNYTGALAISDGATLSTNGLPATGTIQIGGEQLTYNNKTSSTINITARGANSTVAASHLATDPVYIIHASGQATDAYALENHQMDRPRRRQRPQKLQNPPQQFHRHHHASRPTTTRTPILAGSKITTSPPSSPTTPAQPTPGPCPPTPAPSGC